MFPHDIDDNGTDQRVLNDEWIEIGSGVLNNSTHDVDTSTAQIARVSNGSGVCGREQCIETFEITLLASGARVIVRDSGEGLVSIFHTRKDVVED